MVGCTGSPSPAFEERLETHFEENMENTVTIVANGFVIDHYEADSIVINMYNQDSEEFQKVLFKERDDLTLKFVRVLK